MKKLFTLLLAIALAVSSFGRTAFAEETVITHTLFINPYITDYKRLPDDSIEMDLMDLPVFRSSLLVDVGVVPDNSESTDCLSLTNTEITSEYTAEWKSSDPSILEFKLDNNYDVAIAEFKKAGKVDITCEAIVYGEKLTATLQLNLVDKIKNGALTFNAPSYSLKKGEAVQNGTHFKQFLRPFGIELNSPFTVSITDGENENISNPYLTIEDGLFVGLGNGKEISYLFNHEDLNLKIEDESIADFTTYYLDENEKLVKEPPAEDAVAVQVLEAKKDGTTKITATYQNQTATAQIIVGTGVNDKNSSEIEKPIDKTPSEQSSSVSMETEKVNPTTSNKPVALISLLAIISFTVLLLSKRR